MTAKREGEDSNPELNYSTSGEDYNYVTQLPIEEYDLSGWDKHSDNGWEHAKITPTMPKSFRKVSSENWALQKVPMEMLPQMSFGVRDTQTCPCTRVQLFIKRKTGAEVSSQMESRAAGHWLDRALERVTYTPNFLLPKRADRADFSAIKIAEWYSQWQVVLAVFITVLQLAIAQVIEYMFKDQVDITLAEQAHKDGLTLMLQILNISIWVLVSISKAMRFIKRNTIRSVLFAAELQKRMRDGEIQGDLVMSGIYLKGKTYYLILLSVAELGLGATILTSIIWIYEIHVYISKQILDK